MLPAFFSSCRRRIFIRQSSSELAGRFTQPALGLAAALPVTLAWQVSQLISLDTGSTGLLLAIALPLLSMAVTLTIGKKLGCRLSSIGVIGMPLASNQLKSLLQTSGAGLYDAIGLPVRPTSGVRSAPNRG